MKKISLNPNSKKIVGAINQAKKEQDDGNFAGKRQLDFVNFMLKQKDLLARENFPKAIWTDFFGVLDSIITGIQIVSQFQNISPEQKAIHKVTISVLFHVCSANPSKVSFLRVDEDDFFEAVAIPRLV